MTMYHEAVSTMLAGLRGDMRDKEEMQAEIDDIVAGLQEIAVSPIECVRREVQAMFEGLFAATCNEDYRGIALVTEFSERTESTTGPESDMIPVYVQDLKFSGDPERYREQLIAATIRELAGWICDHHTQQAPTHGFLCTAVELGRAVVERTGVDLNASDILDTELWGLPPLQNYISACQHPAYIFWFDLMQFRDNATHLEGYADLASEILRGQLSEQDDQLTASTSEENELLAAENE